MAPTASAVAWAADTPAPLPGGVSDGMPGPVTCPAADMPSGVTVGLGMPTAAAAVTVAAGLGAGLVLVGLTIAPSDVGLGQLTVVVERAHRRAAQARRRHLGQHREV